LFIDPDECIDCNACVSECPWEAIYPEEDVPSALEPDVALNALVLKRRAEFRLPTIEPKEAPTSAEVAENKRRWGM
jgi:ferredoxin